MDHSALLKALDRSSICGKGSWCFTVWWLAEVLSVMTSALRDHPSSLAAMPEAANGPSRCDMGKSGISLAKLLKTSHPVPAERVPVKRVWAL